MSSGLTRKSIARCHADGPDLELPSQSLEPTFHDAFMAAPDPGWRLVRLESPPVARKIRKCRRNVNAKKTTNQQRVQRLPTQYSTSMFQSHSMIAGRLIFFCPLYALCRFPDLDLCTDKFIAKKARMSTMCITHNVWCIYIACVDRMVYHPVNEPM